MIIPAKVRKKIKDATFYLCIFHVRVSRKERGTTFEETSVVDIGVLVWYMLLICASMSYPFMATMRRSRKKAREICAFQTKRSPLRSSFR